jgi:hypothetical protein
VYGYWHVKSGLYTEWEYLKDEVSELGEQYPFTQEQLPQVFVCEFSKQSWVISDSGQIFLNSESKSVHLKGNTSKQLPSPLSPFLKIWQYTPTSCKSQGLLTSAPTPSQRG